jgi:hypothetical protein
MRKLFSQLGTVYAGAPLFFIGSFPDLRQFVTLQHFFEKNDIN